VTSFVEWLLDHKYVIRLLIGDVSYDKRIRVDLLTSLQTRGIKRQGGQILDEPVTSVEDVIAQLAETDVVVATRFHNIVLALMLGKPVLAIAYHEKIESLMAGMGLAKYCQSIDQLDVNLLQQQFVQIEQNAGLLKPAIELKTDEHRLVLDEQYRKIFNLCADSPRA
jgi:polysaccharide pyruvyl transferase WcaK-like protein